MINFDPTNDRIVCQIAFTVDKPVNPLQRLHAGIGLETLVQFTTPVVVDHKANRFRVLTLRDSASTDDLREAVVVACQEVFRRALGDGDLIETICAKAVLNPGDRRITAQQILILKRELGE